MSPTVDARDGYWCECWTQSPATGAAPALIGSFETATPREAVRWVRANLFSIATALDEQPFKQARYWVTTGQDYAIDALQHGHAFTLTLTQRTTHITWTARPVSFLPLLHRRNAQLPPCAYRFAPKARTPRA